MASLCSRDTMAYKTKLLITVAIFLTGLLFLFTLKNYMRPYAIGGFYFQQFSSETLMQTVPIEDLRNTPIQTLFNIHIQPPILDIIRAILVHLSPSSDLEPLLHRVDKSLYILWNVLYGILGALIFYWLSGVIPSGLAILVSLFFLAHPASILYATILDGTLLSSVIILWAFYLLWNIRENQHKPIALITIVMLLLFFTRSIFQWPSILVFGLSLLLLRVPKRRVILFLIIVGGISGLYLGKQYYKFGLLSTSSFTGLNLTRSIGYNSMGSYWNYLKFPENSQIKGDHLANVLVRKRKFIGVPNFNHISYLKLNKYLKDEYKSLLRTTPLRKLIKSYAQNARIYFNSSSIYGRHVIVDRIPWRGLYDDLFSFPILPAAIILALIMWLARIKDNDYIKGIAFALPAFFIFFVSILFEKGENMRFKFFLEPVIFIFIITQFFISGKLVYQKVRTHLSTRS